ncbi:bola-like protein [Trichocladium antarcticum]|uniref:Bola-like protein n=1 Tax=Trichocladium antarcticum TaxID=1450529 RepID=A0AAN6UM12_9PEZI|nr:bola-like protein [Trichocladium antarcticum]
MAPVGGTFRIVLQWHSGEWGLGGQSRGELPAPTRITRKNLPHHGWIRTFQSEPPASRMRVHVPRRDTSRPLGLSVDWSYPSDREVDIPSELASRVRPRSTDTYRRTKHLQVIDFPDEFSTSGAVSSAPAETEAVAPAATSELKKPGFLSEGESQVWDILLAEFAPTQLVVQDISGGCGSMYGIEICSEKFRGLNMLKQQRLVNASLGDLVKQWHGVQLKTRAP